MPPSVFPAWIPLLRGILQTPKYAIPLLLNDLPRYTGRTNLAPQIDPSLIPGIADILVVPARVSTPVMVMFPDFAPTKTQDFGLSFLPQFLGEMFQQYVRSWLEIRVCCRQIDDGLICTHHLLPRLKFYWHWFAVGVQIQYWSWSIASVDQIDVPIRCCKKFWWIQRFENLFQCLIGYPSRIWHFSVGMCLLLSVLWQSMLTIWVMLKWGRYTYIYIETWICTRSILPCLNKG